MRRRVVILAAIAGWLVMAACLFLGVALRFLDPVPIIENAFQLETGCIPAVAILAATWVSAGPPPMIRRPDHAGEGGCCSSGWATPPRCSRLRRPRARWRSAPAGADAARWFGWLAGLATLMGSGVFYLALIYPTGRGYTRALGNPRCQILC